MLCRYGVSSTYYGISLNISGFGLNVYLTHFIYAAIEVPAKLMIYGFLNIIGRRKCQAGTLLITGICIAINIFVPEGCHAQNYKVIAGSWCHVASQVFNASHLYFVTYYELASFSFKLTDCFPHLSYARCTYFTCHLQLCGMCVLLLPFLEKAYQRLPSRRSPSTQRSFTPQSSGDMHEAAAFRGPRLPCWTFR